MFGQLLSGLSFVTVLLLALFYYSYNEPTQVDDESDGDYYQRLDDYKCRYSSQRNFLLVVLSISTVACIYKLATKDNVMIGGSDNIEVMGEDEEDLYKGGEHQFNDDDESAVLSNV